MKKILLTTAFALAVASPALAATTHHMRHNAVAAPYAQDSYAYAQADATTVVSDGKVIGRDPDAFIRQSLLRQGDNADLAGN